METTNAVKTASARIWYALRCHWCEVLFSWSLKMSPPGYVASYIEATVKAAEGGRAALEQIAGHKRS